MAIPRLICSFTRYATGRVALTGPALFASLISPRPPKWSGPSGGSAALRTVMSASRSGWRGQTRNLANRALSYRHRRMRVDLGLGRYHVSPSTHSACGRPLRTRHAIGQLCPRCNCVSASQLPNEKAPENRTCQHAWDLGSVTSNPGHAPRSTGPSRRGVSYRRGHCCSHGGKSGTTLATSHGRAAQRIIAQKRSGIHGFSVFHTFLARR